MVSLILLTLINLMTVLYVNCEETPQRPTNQQYEWGAKAAKKYNALRFSIDFFDIDKVDEYALYLKKHCLDFPAKSNSKNFGAGCDLTLSKHAAWSKKLSEQGYSVQKIYGDIEPVIGWVCFCNAHGAPIEEIVKEYIKKGDSYGLNKAINYIQMSNELCVQPKENAQNTNDPEPEAITKQD